MQSTTVACLALLCLAALISTGSTNPIDDANQYDLNLGHDTHNLARANRCRSMGNCVHDRICDSNCKQFGYKDGECSGNSCICCA